ncbi:testis-expressed protein 264 isoform 2-T2 [Menidia menidia]
MPDFILCVVLILLGLFILTVVGYTLHAGLFTDVSVQTGCAPIKKVTFAYKFKDGLYKNCGELFKEALCIGPGLSCIGVFYDDPQKVCEPCRYAAGSILSEGENEVNEELLRRYKASGFNVFSLPQVTHVVTTSFPQKTFFSNLLRVRRVYPRLEHYIKRWATSQTPRHLEIWFKCGAQAGRQGWGPKGEDNIADIHSDLKKLTCKKRIKASFAQQRIGTQFWCGWRCLLQFSFLSSAGMRFN